jgi:hypothetical protein
LKKKTIPEVMLEHADLKPGNIRIRFDFELPKGYHMNPDASPQFSIYSDNDKLLMPDEMELNIKEQAFEVPVQINEGSGSVNIELILYYCDTENEGICKFKDILFRVPVTTIASGSDNLNIRYTLN